MDNIKMPGVIHEYITASNTKDIAKAISLFTDDAEVSDEGAVYHGMKEILEWQQKIHTAYDFHMEVKEVSLKQNTYLVTTTLSGTFPGKNPVDVVQSFVVKDDKISQLNIQ